MTAALPSYTTSGDVTSGERVPLFEGTVWILPGPDWLRSQRHRESFFAV